MYFWDNTPANSATKRELSAQFAKDVIDAEAQGVLVVTRHVDCPNKNHIEYCVSISKFGKKYPSQKYVWSNWQLYQGERLCKCPCSESNKVSQHTVIDDFFFSVDCDKRVSQAIASYLIDLGRAIDYCEGKRPRSGIREVLLRALIQVNDAILPESVEDYIQRVECERVAE